jgi:hypothetical protein
MDVTCRDCGTKLGEVLNGSSDPDAHMCFDCHVSSQGHSATEWLHILNHPQHIGHMSPVTTFSVCMRGPYDDVIPWDDDMTVELCHEDLRDDPVPMVMGNMVRRMTEGRVTIDNLYIRGLGCFRLRLSVPGLDPICTFSFRVT